MKKSIKLIIIMVITTTLIVLAQIGGALAQDGPLTLPWTVISAGGGESGAGDYHFISTFGQPIAGQVSSGPYTLNSGFLGFPKARTTVPMPYILFLPLLTK